jgi:hypothetical protein
LRITIRTWPIERNTPRFSAGLHDFASSGLRALLEVGATQPACSPTIRRNPESLTIGWEISYAAAQKPMPP